MLFIIDISQYLDLSQNNKGCALTGTRTSNNNNNHNFECLNSMFANHHNRVVLRSSVGHIDG